MDLQRFHLIIFLYNSGYNALREKRGKTPRFLREFRGNSPRFLQKSIDMASASRL